MSNFASDNEVRPCVNEMILPGQKLNAIEKPAKRMTKEEIEAKLQKAGVKRTPVRYLIYKLLTEAKAPLSAKEIENGLETVDRSSISRTLSLFHDRDLIHSIDDGSGAMRYEACTSMHGHSFTDQHVHFHCTKCDRTECLEEVVVTMSMLPDGYKLRNVNFMLTGICAACANKENMKNG